MTTGSINPFMSGLAVFSLNCLTNPAMLTPCGPSAVPTGGAGVAPPPGHWILTIAVTCLAIGSPVQRPAARAGPGSFALRRKKHALSVAGRGVGMLIVSPTGECQVPASLRAAGFTPAVSEDGRGKPGRSPHTLS